jgi:predicted Zn-dependent protease
MFKLIGLLVAAMPVILFVRAMFMGSKKRSQAVSHRLPIAGAWLLAATIAAPAQPQPSRTGGGLGPIDEVLLYVHSDLKSTGFVEPLVCALRRVLVAPVNAADKIAARVVAATAAEGGAGTFKYLLHPYDMRDGQFRYVFATSYANAAPPYHVGIVSMARLDPTDPEIPRARRAEIGATRAYKLILKSIAILAGLPNTGGCILAFPRTLEELDRKPAEFCPADREALVAAKVLKAEESAGCVYVSERR